MRTRDLTRIDSSQRRPRALIFYYFGPRVVMHGDRYFGLTMAQLTYVDQVMLAENCNC